MVVRPTPHPLPIARIHTHEHPLHSLRLHRSSPSSSKPRWTTSSTFNPRTKIMSFTSRSVLPPIFPFSFSLILGGVLILELRPTTSTMRADPMFKLSRRTSYDGTYQSTGSFRFVSFELRSSSSSSPRLDSFGAHPPFDIQEEHDITSSRGSASFVWRCSFCKVSLSLLLPSPPSFSTNGRS